MRSLISPNFTAQKLETGKLEDWIDVFEDRMVNWTLRQAWSLLKIPNGDYSIVQLLMPYFEGICVYQKGEDSHRRSEEFFREGFLSVFLPGNLKKETLERIAEVLYEDARCGFFHDYMIRSRIFFSLDNSKFPAPLNITFPKKTSGEIDYDGEIQSIVINAEEFLKEIEAHLKEYITQLRNENNHDLRGRFQKAWNIKHPPGRPPIIIGIQ